MLTRQACSASRRTLASVTAESPRITIARNLVKMEQVATANNEAALNAARNANVSVNPAALPETLSGLEAFLAVPASASKKVWRPNPKHYHRGGFFNYIGTAFSREFGAIPLFSAVGIFFVGFFFTEIFLDEKGKETSFYETMKREFAHRQAEKARKAECEKKGIAYVPKKFHAHGDHGHDDHHAHH